MEIRPSEVYHQSHESLEMQLMSTPVGFITVCAAAAGDIIAWILLALLVSLINATSPTMPLYVILLALAWCLILVYAVRPLLMYLVRLTHSVSIDLCDRFLLTTNTAGLRRIYLNHFIRRNKQC